MSNVIDEPTIARITANGQISLPADIRRRWGVNRVAIIDRGSLAIVRAVPDDPIAYYRGRFKATGSPTSQEMRAEGIREEIEAERAKSQRVGAR